MNSLLNFLPVDRFKVAVAKLWQSDFVHKIAGTFATRIAMTLLGLIMTVAVARVLGPEGRGLYAVTIAIGAIGVQFGNLGLHASNTYYVSRRPGLLLELMGNSLLAGLGLGSLGVLIAWVIFTFWPRLAPVQGTLLWLGLISVPLGLTYILLQSLLLGLHRIRAYNGLDLGSKALSTMLIGVLILLNWVTPGWLVSTVMVGTTASLLWCFYILVHHAKGMPRIGAKVFIDSIGYGSRSYLSAFFSFLTMRLGLFIVQYRFGAEITGYYSIALTLAELTYLFPVVVGNLLFPRLSAMTDETAKREAAHQLAWVVGIVMTLICLVTGLIAKWLIPLLFGAEFIPAAPILYGFLPGVVALSANTIYMNYFASVGQPLVVVYSPASASGLLVVVSMMSFINITPVGIAITTSLAWFIMFVNSMFWLARKQANK